ncbi:MAG TPA: LCP family protein [Candidatus Eisenbergiella merdipullorum]|uniref:LCP family protein n=1 Tax=Candidatus Eisenbergiella merdipullorum TaxID=2838553 RepID=A0A9D2I4Y7_9FIRM|nr:LCP family protein [Candidatus Eisenbergiella merdipullorum]
MQIEKRRKKRRRKRSRASSHSRRTAQRKILRRAGLAVLILAGAFVLLGGVLTAGYFWLRERGRASLEEKQEALPQEMEAAAVSGNEADPALGDGMIRYNGKIYAYKQNCLTFLCMGIDKRGEMEASDDLLKGGQADAIFLAVLDPEEKKISVIGVNRDTMTEISVYDEDGLYIGKRTAQIALQHAYGDGMETSCERMVEAVSHLFYGIPIHGYCSLNMEVITLLNDEIGGVTVTVPEDLSVRGQVKWKAGEQVHLTGDDAYTFVQYRDTGIAQSAEGRLARQKAYLQAFITQAKEAMRKDMTLPLSLYEMVSPYMVTDISAEEAVYLATQALSYSFDPNDIYTMEGEVVMGEKYEEFYQDDTALYELILRVFYEEVEENTDESPE